MTKSNQISLLWRSLLMFSLLLFLKTTTFTQKKVADFSFKDTEGKDHHLYEDYLNKKKIVVIDLFFVDCPPCNQIAPFLKASYEFWGKGQKNVAFIAISPFDNDTAIELFRNNHSLEYPFSGTSGGGNKVLEQFTNGFFGRFDGYPTLIIIRPDGSVIYDISSYQGDQETIDLLDLRIKEVLDNLEFDNQLEIFPNPSRQLPEIYFDAEPGEYEFSVVNIKGQKVFNASLRIEERRRVDLSEMIKIKLTSGHYFVALINKGRNVVQSKIVIL